MRPGRQAWPSCVAVWCNFAAFAALKHVRTCLRKAPFWCYLRVFLRLFRVYVLKGGVFSRLFRAYVLKDNGLKRSRTSLRGLKFAYELKGLKHVRNTKYI